MTRVSFVSVVQGLIRRDRKDPDSEPEQGLSLVPGRRGCWGLRVLILAWGSWPDSGLTAYMLQLSLGWEASGLKRTFQEPQLESLILAFLPGMASPRLPIFPVLCSCVQHLLLRDCSEDMSPSDPSTIKLGTEPGRGRPGCVLLPWALRSCPVCTCQ